MKAAKSKLVADVRDMSTDPIFLALQFQCEVSARLRSGLLGLVIGDLDGCDGLKGLYELKHAVSCQQGDEESKRVSLHAINVLIETWPEKGSK